ncbi:MAG: desulfoferrodoxin family protein [Anaerovoracaceae bacterium]|jgi:superoxide reductase
MLKFFKCNKCGNFVDKFMDSGVPMICCGEPMTEVTANTEEASVEKHIPEVSVDGDRIDAVVGSVLHPMEEAHYIQWIYVETEKGAQRKMLKPGDEPKASFKIVDDKAVAVYEYCNLHGLWKKEV